MIFKVWHCFSDPRKRVETHSSDIFGGLKKEKYYFRKIWLFFYLDIPSPNAEAPDTQFYFLEYDRRHAKDVWLSNNRTEKIGCFGIPHSEGAPFDSPCHEPITPAENSECGKNNCDIFDVLIWDKCLTENEQLCVFAFFDLIVGPWWSFLFTLSFTNKVL